MILTFAASAQKVENLRTTFDGEKVIVQYDLNHNNPAQVFKVTLYSSHNNYAHALTSLSGDVGEHVIPGKDRKIIWDARNSLPADFDQEITIKIKISLVAAGTSTAAETGALKIRSFDRSAYKKGSTIELHWSGGKPGDKINIELLKNGEVKQKIGGNVNNTHKFAWVVPKKGEGGKGYSIRVSPAGKPAEFSSSSDFAIKPQVGLGIKALPILVAGAIIMLLPDPPDDVLPGPTKPD